MANFEDITGWWEELDSYLDSEEYDAVQESQAMPVNWLLELMHLVLRHTETREIFMTCGKWLVANHLYDKNGSIIPLEGGLPNDFPYTEMRRADLFAVWFFNIGKNVRKILPVCGGPPAMVVARLIAEGREDITQKELLAKLKRTGEINSFSLGKIENE